MVYSPSHTNGLTHIHTHAHAHTRTHTHAHAFHIDTPCKEITNGQHKNRILMIELRRNEAQQMLISYMY